MEYPALFEPDPKGGILVTFPDFGFSTHGDNEIDAYGMAQDLLIHMLSDRIAGKQEILRPGKLRSKQGRVRPVALPALTAAKVALYEEFRASRLTKSELARRMGQPKQQIERLFDLRRASRMDQMEAAFAALGKRLAIEVQAA